MDSGLAGARVLVTGAAGGIGAAIVRALDAEGAVPLLHCRSSLARAEALAAECGAGAEVVQADLRQEAEVERMYRQALEGGARLDAVVVNAGIWTAEPSPVHAMTLAQWEQTMASDLRSAFLTCRGFLRHLASEPREEAAIVLVGSTAALFGEADHADYAAAKAGLVHGLAPSLKNEIVRLAPRGRVNSVCPGWVRTPMAADSLADAGTVEHVVATMAMRKVGEPEDVARAVLWLLSPRLCGHVSGAVVPVHGGMEGRLLH